MAAINKSYIIDADNDMLNIDNGGLDTNIKNQASFSGDAIVCTNYADDYGVRGNRYLCNNVETLTAGSTIACLLDLSSVPAGNMIFMLPIVASSSESEIRFRVYEDTDYAGGTPKTPININRLSSNTPTFVVTEGATGTNKGTKMTEHVVFASSGLFGLSTSGSGDGSSPLILDTSKNYLIEFENVGGNATTLEYDTTIFDIPASE